MPDKNIISPILLAAGQSKRFGSDKLLHPISYRGKTKPLILQTLAPWLAVFPEVNVVIRDDNNDLKKILAQCAFSGRIKLILAHHAHRGMSASLISGLKANREAAAWLIGLADMPFINNVVVSKSLMALQTGALITQAEFGGRRGHPVGFSSQFLPQLLALHGDKGAKQIIDASAHLITPVISPDAGIYRDIDTKENLAI